MKKKKGNKAKGLVGYGIGSMAGLGAMGAMNAIPGMPVNTLTGTVGTGLNLGAIGQVANIGLDMFSNNSCGKQKKSTVKRIINKF